MHGVSHRRLSGERPAIPTARGSARDLEAVRRLILENPGIVEADLFPLDTHLRAGNGGLIDLLAVDGTGALAVIEIDLAGEDDLLRRSLEHQGWVGTQVHFLRRLYGPERIHPFHAPRAILLGKRFSPAFLRKISDLPVSITALVYRFAASEGPSSLQIEPAAGGAGPEKGGPVLRSSISPIENPPPPDADPDGAERLTSEELEAFYRYERERLRRKEEGVLDR